MHYCRPDGILSLFFWFQIWRRIRRRLLSLSSCLSVPPIPHTFVPALEKREIGGTSFTLLSCISPCLFIYCPPIPSLGPVQPGSTVNLEGGLTLYISLLEHQPIKFRWLLSADQPWHRTQVPSPKKDILGFFCKTLFFLLVAGSWDPLGSLCGSVLWTQMNEDHLYLGRGLASTNHLAHRMESI